MDRARPREPGLFMTDTYDDLDDLDKVWHQDDPLLSRDVEVDFGLEERPVFDDDPAVEDRPEVVEELGAYDEFDDEERVVALHGHDRFRSGRVSRRKTTTLLHASTVTIAVGIGAIGVMLALVILMGRLLTARQLFFMAQSVIGTWLVYPGYRADAPPGADLALYPRQYLLRTPDLRFWESFAMEWNVHVGWITPFLATAVAFVALRYGKRLVADFQVRKMLTNLFVIAFATAVIAWLLGALVNIAAPNDYMHRAWNP